jgi:multiple sugar transport system ATP-binding protein
LAEVRLEGVTLAFPRGALAVDGVDLVARDGECLVLVGPSGSGKSTLLRIVAGLELPTSGRVLIDGEDVTALPPQQRNLAMVFQNYALYPHKTVRENLAFGLRVRRTPAATIRERVDSVAAVLGIGALLDRRPGQLSGGERQRVALGRAMVREPRAFLLDEPLSNLDPALRIQTRAELARLQRRLEATILHVTHDQEEAMTLGHRVAVLKDGRIQQVAPPMVLFREPANRFVAGFIGSPPMNLLPCTLESSEGDTYVRGHGFTLSQSAARPPPSAGRSIVLGVRPQDVELVDAGQEGSRIVGAVDLVELLGSSALLHLALDTPTAGIAASPSEGREASGLGREQLRVVVPAEKTPRKGDVFGARLPAERLHWFDGETGARLV